MLLSVHSYSTHTLKLTLLSSEYFLNLHLDGLHVPPEQIVAREPQLDVVIYIPGRVLSFHFRTPGQQLFHRLLPPQSSGLLR